MVPDVRVEVEIAQSGRVGAVAPKPARYRWVVPVINSQPPGAVVRCGMSGRGWAWPEWSSGWIVVRPDRSVWFEHDRDVDIDPRGIRLPLDMDLLEIRRRRFMEAAGYSGFRFPALSRNAAVVMGAGTVTIVLLVRRRDATRLVTALRSQGVLRSESPPTGQR